MDAFNQFLARAALVDTLQKEQKLSEENPWRHTNLWLHVIPAEDGLIISVHRRYGYRYETDERGNRVSINTDHRFDDVRIDIRDISDSTPAGKTILGHHLEEELRRGCNLMLLDPQAYRPQNWGNMLFFADRLYRAIDTTMEFDTKASVLESICKFVRELVAVWVRVSECFSACGMDSALVHISDPLWDLVSHHRVVQDRASAGRDHVKEGGLYFT